MLVYDNKLSEYRAVHPPDVGDRILAAALADEINLRSLGIPDGTDIVRRMERQLRQAGTIRMTHEAIGIPLPPGAVLQTVASDQDDLASVRRNNRRRKGAVRVGKQAFLDAGRHVDPPDFSPSRRVDARTDYRLDIVHVGVHSLAIGREEIVLQVKAPQADALEILPAEKNLGHVGIEYRRKILAVAGNLATDKTLFGIRQENLVASPDLLGKNDPFPIGRERKVHDCGPLGPLDGRTLAIQVLDKQIADTLPDGNIAKATSIGTDPQDGIGRPVGPGMGATDQRHGNPVIV